MAATYINPNSCNKPGCYLVYNNSAVVGNSGTPTLLQGILTLTDDSGKQVKIPWADILPGKAVEKTCYTPGTKKQVTVTVNTAPSAACCGNIVDYNITLRWNDSCSSTTQMTYRVQGFGDAADTAISVATKIVTAINADPNAVVVASNVAGSSAVVTLVALAVGINFQVDATASLMTAATTVANINPSGSVADLVSAGIPTTLLAAGGFYTVMAIPYWYKSPATGQSTDSGDQASLVGQHTCFVIVQEDGVAERNVFTNAGSLQDMMAGNATGGLTYANYLSKHPTNWCNDSGV